MQTRASVKSTPWCSINRLDLRHDLTLCEASLNHSSVPAKSTYDHSRPLVKTLQSTYTDAISTSRMMWVCEQTQYTETSPFHGKGCFCLEHISQELKP